MSTAPVDDVPDSLHPPAFVAQPAVAASNPRGHSASPARGTDLPARAPHPAGLGAGVCAAAGPAVGRLQRRRHRRLCQRRHVRAAGAGPEHRRRLHRAAGSRLRRVLRARRLHLRSGGVVSAEDPVVGAVDCRSSGSVRSARCASAPATWRSCTSRTGSCCRIAALICAGFGLMFGAPTLRLRGDYLAIVTLGFGEIVPIVLRNASGITNGAQGLPGVRDAVDLRLQLRVRLAAVLLPDPGAGRRWWCSSATDSSSRGPGAPGWRCARMSWRPARWASTTSTTSCWRSRSAPASAGLAGTFHVAKLTTATPDMFQFTVSTIILVMVVLGGMGSIPGVALGALILTIFQSLVLGGSEQLGARPRQRDRRGVPENPRPDPGQPVDLRRRAGGDDAVPAPGAHPRAAVRRRAQRRRPDRRQAGRGGFKPTFVISEPDPHRQAR